MKKFLKTGKKTLSVFMAVLMAFTALVFAMPEMASAVSAGKYYVRVTCHNDDAKNAKGSYTAPWQDKNGGYSVDGNYGSAKSTNGRTSYNSGGGYTIFYKNSAGTETWTTSSVVDIESFYYKDAGNEGKTTTFTTAVEGFPTKIQYYNCESDGFSVYEATWYIEEIEVANNKNMTGATTIWSGQYGATSHTFARVGYIYPNASTGKTEMTMPKGGWSSSQRKTNSGYESKWISPVPSKIDWVSASEANLTISTGSNTVNRQFKFNILDQYGVVMSTSALEAAGAEPTVSIKATDFGTVSKTNSENLYYGYTNGTDNYTTTVYAKPALKSLVRGINSHKVTVNVSVPGTGISESKTFTIYDPKYTVFFDANGGTALAPASTEVYYGESLASQAKLDNTSNYPTGGTYAGHSWLGLFDAKTGGNPMNPDATVTASKTYYAHWDENTYVVVFLDKEGKCVDIQYVGYGQNADGAAAREKLGDAKYTADKHYTFNRWDRSLVNVSGNLIVNAVYDDAEHTFDAGTPVAANCQHGEGTEFTCTVCGYKKVTETSSVKGDHTLTGLIQDVAPTCTETGKGHKECTVCGEIVEADIEIPALGHSYKIEEKTPATCTNEGERTLTCTRCGESHTEAIPKTQHNYVKVNHVPATCNSSAYDVMECSVCKDSYNLYLGAASDEHTWTESYDKEAGILTLTCSVCGTVKTVDIGANLTDFVGAAVTKEPTCKEDGIVTVTAGDDSFTVTIGKDKIPHKYETEVTPATCTDDGKIINVCTVCGNKDEANAKTIAKLGHDLEERITTPATCTATGVKTISCKRADCTYSKTENIPATGHKTSEVVVDCTSGGVIKCVYCDKEIGTIPAKDHDYTGPVREDEATCDKNGVRYTKCATCGAEKAELTAKKDHTYGAWEVMVPAKCGAQGVEKRTCTCGAYEVRTIDALAHDIITAEETSATCTKAGVKVDKCQRTGCDYQNTVVTQPTGHKLDGGTVHPQTCTTGKYTVYTCTNTDANTGKKCDYQSFEIATGEEGKALGHDFSVVESTVAATCEKDGSQVMKCLRCDEKETVVLPKLGHNFIAKKTVAATCTTGSYTVMECENEGCDATYKEYKGDPNGHTWGAWVVTKASTNSEPGEMERTCTVLGCGSKEIAQIPAGGHSFEGAKGEVIIVATCHSKGLTKYTCTAHTDCGVSIEVETAETPHKLYTSITYPKCERIYNEDGTYNDTFTPGKIRVYCVNSGCSYEDETATIVLPISGHNWGDFQTLTEATCAKPGKSVRYCKNCGAADYNEIPATEEHHFIPTVVAPTCEERGYTIYACQGCGLTYRDDFTNALGHDYDDGVVVEATCTTPGGILYTCKRVFQSEKIVDGKKEYVDVPCGHTKFVEDESKPATGHNMGEWKYVDHPSVGDAYAKERICMNPGCTYSEYEKGAGADHEAEDGVNIYYKVSFYNEWVTDTYEEIKSNKVYSNPYDTPVYTKLASTYKTVKLASIYVLKNTEAVYPGKTAPVREKDRDWGGYYFEGWTETAGCKAVGKDELSVPADLSKITGNTDLYALFKCRDVYYKVRFYNADGTPLTKQTVILHAHSAEWPSEFGTPQLADNVTWKYEFTGWAYDYTKIYDDVAIMAVYKSIAKKYNVEYYNDANVLIGSETVVNGQKLNTPKITPERFEDMKYVYVFTGTWTFANGAPVNVDHFAVPTTAKEGDTIKVYAKYSKRQKVYPVKLHVVDPYDSYAPLEGVTVQIMDSKGQLVATGETDSNGDISFSLYYDSYFTYSAVRGNYYKEGIMSFDDGVEGNVLKLMLGTNDYQGTIQLEVKEDPNDGKKCGCICHTFFSGIWITFMNLLYRVFGIKHVCCYDMYAVHGDKLAYGKS